MKIEITDTRITLKDSSESFSILEKPVFPNFHHNVTKRPYISTYYEAGETIWGHCQGGLELLADFCHEDPYFGCYALLFRRLYPLLLSSSQAKNVLAYGQPANCGAYKVFQNFMTFLQEGNALTALAQSSFSFQVLSEQSCHAFLYCLDTHPALTAVCDALKKVRQGGVFCSIPCRTPRLHSLSRYVKRGRETVWAPARSTPSPWMRRFPHLPAQTVPIIPSSPVRKRC